MDIFKNNLLGHVKGSELRKFLKQKFILKKQKYVSTEEITHPRQTLCSMSKDVQSK